MNESTVIKALGVVLLMVLGFLGAYLFTTTTEQEKKITALETEVSHLKEKMHTAHPELITYSRTVTEHIEEFPVNP